MKLISPKQARATALKARETASERAEAIHEFYLPTFAQVIDEEVRSAAAKGLFSVRVPSSTFESRIVFGEGLSAAYEEGKVEVYSSLSTDLKIAGYATSVHVHLPNNAHTEVTLEISWANAF